MSLYILFSEKNGGIHKIPYKIPCPRQTSFCASSQTIQLVNSYAAQIGFNTYRHLKVRVFEHIGKSYHTDTFLGCSVHSEIRDHCHKKDHAMVPGKFVIIDKWRYKNDLLILESLHQKIKKPSLGTHEQSTPLLSFD